MLTFHGLRYSVTFNASAESTWKERPKFTLPAHTLTGLTYRMSYHMSHMSYLRHQLTGRDMSLQKIKQGSHFGVLTGYNLTQGTNSWKPQAKIRLAFHFVESNETCNPLYYLWRYLRLVYFTDDLTILHVESWRVVSTWRHFSYPPPQPLQTLKYFNKSHSDDSTVSYE